MLAVSSRPMRSKHSQRRLSGLPILVRASRLSYPFWRELGFSADAVWSRLNHDVTLLRHTQNFCSVLPVCSHTKIRRCPPNGPPPVPDVGWWGGSYLAKTRSHEIRPMGLMIRELRFVCQ